MELQNTVKEALNALYHHPDDAVRMQADRWLQDFQHTIDAWQVFTIFLIYFFATNSNLRWLIALPTLSSLQLQFNYILSFIWLLYFFIIFSFAFLFLARFDQSVVFGYWRVLSSNCMAIEEFLGFCMNFECAKNSMLTFCLYHSGST